MDGLSKLWRTIGPAIVGLLALVVVLALIVPASSATEDSSESDTLHEIAIEPDTQEEPVNWVDDTHAYATDQAQALAEWMDGFFGDPTYDLEKPMSLVRILWRNSLDQSDGYNTKVLLRGKLQLPKISKRLNLFFGGENGDEIANDEAKSEDRAGLLYTIDQRRRSRVDLTVGLSSMGFKPGVRFRNQGPIHEGSSYRFTQQVEYKDNKGFFTTGELNLDQALSETNLLRLSNEFVYGENTEGTEWQSALILYQRRSLHKADPRVFAWFGSINGRTDPEYVKNYQLGVLFRRQLYRPFLFVELQPSYGLRKNNADDTRRGAWSVQLNFEIALERDLRRTRDVEEQGAPASAPD